MFMADRERERERERETTRERKKERGRERGILEVDGEERKSNSQGSFCNAALQTEQRR